MNSLQLGLLCLISVWSFYIPQVESYHSKNIGPRIIGGELAEETEFPYMVAIWTSSDIGRYFCGGAVIGARWILTAAHCVLNAVSFSIQLGSVNLSGSDENRITLAANTSVIHPDFDADKLINNIGLIYLDEDLEFNDYVNVIALPTAPLDDYTTTTSIGWGQTDDDNSGPVNSLYKVSVVTYANEHCQIIYGDQITDSMVCAMGSFNEGTCIGDIGSPLVLNDEGNVHVGVASFLSGNGCESVEPSGYERTFVHLEWIKTVTGMA